MHRGEGFGTEEVFGSVCQNLFELGYKFGRAEVQIAISEAITFLWENDIDAEVPAIISLVEDTLFAANRYEDYLTSTTGGH